MMTLKAALCFFAVLYAVQEVKAVTVSLHQKSVHYIPSYENSVGGQQFDLHSGLADQLAYDPLSRQIWTVGQGRITVLKLGIDLSLTRLAVDYHGSSTAFTQIRHCGCYFLILADSNEHPYIGRLLIYKRFNPKAGFLQLVQSIPVGVNPIDVIASKDCRNILVGLTGGTYQEYAQDDSPYTTDPPGEILRLQFRSRDLRKPSKSTKMDFTDFDHRVDELKAEGVIQYDETVSLSTDLEPKYLLFNKDETKAWVALQKNNAIAEIDLQTNQVTRIKGLGFKDHNMTDQGLDPSDFDIPFPDNININTWPVFGAPQPDQIALIVANGEEYLVSANEGVSSSAVASKVKDLMLDPAVFADPDFLQMLENLGNLNVFDILGDPDGDGTFTELYSFGTRDGSLLDARTLESIANTGDAFEKNIAEKFPELFNSLASSSAGVTLEDRVDIRSENQGPETESVATLCICGGNHWLVFWGLERPGFIVGATLDSTNPSAGFKIQELVHGMGNTELTSEWLDLYKNRMAHSLDPEGLRTVPARYSPTGKPLLLVSGSVSSTVTVYEINVICE